MQQTGYAQAISYAGQSALGASNALEQVTPVLEGQAKRLNASAQDIEGLANRLHALADRLLGQTPVGDGKAGAPTPAPTHSIGKLNDAHGWLENARVNLSSAVSRLESL